MNNEIKKIVKNVLKEQVEYWYNFELVKYEVIIGNKLLGVKYKLLIGGHLYTLSDSIDLIGVTKDTIKDYIISNLGSKINKHLFTVALSCDF